MRHWYICLAVFALFGCGSDDSDGNKVVINTDAGGFDVAEAQRDGGDNNSSNSNSNSNTHSNNDNNQTPAETPRDDLDVVIEDREVEFEAGYSGRLAFDVPDDAISVTVNVTGEPGTSYTLSEWKNGDGSDVVGSTWIDTDQGAPALCLSCENRIASSEAAFAAMLPNNENTELQSGTHNISLYAYKQSGFSVSPLSAGTAMLRVVVKRLPEEPADGVLDINFHLTGANGWTAETAPDDAEFQQLLADVDELYDQVGVDIGVVTYTDIGEEYQVIESVILPDSELQEMFALSEHQPRNAINVFVVEELMTGFGGGFGVLLGVSGGIPGPPVAGTHRSGVAVSTKRDDEVPTALFKVLAHEIGHHLGLFHTSEQPLGGPQIHDPLGDTGENDTSLLMYHSGEGETITAMQGEVMRRNNWVNHGGAQ